jgi:tetratricopeptide (TPR) repeat protein
MDPITKMAQEFMGSWLRFRQTGKVRLFRIDTDPSMHHDLGRIFRAIEMSPDNRSPYFIFDTPFLNRHEFFEAAVRKLGSDYALIREGLSNDGVSVGELNFNSERTQDSAATFAQSVESVWNQVKSQFEYLMLIFLPQKIELRKDWATAIEELLLMFRSSKVRIAVADTPERFLAELQDRYGKESMVGKFFISQSTLQEYLLKIAAGGFGALNREGRSDDASVKAHKPAEDASKSLKANGHASAQSPDPAGLSPYEAARLRTCMAKAAIASAEGKVEASLEALRDGRTICQRNGLLTHDAILLMAMANTLIAAQRHTQALEYYDEAIAVATRAAAPVVVMQARMGTASVLFRVQNYERAAASYQQAADDATAAESEIMRIEALRMAGTCHNLRGRPDAAAACWNQALGAGTKISLREFDASTIDQIGNEFVAMCEKNGLAEQAKSIKQQIETIRVQALLREREQTAVNLSA